MNTSRPVRFSLLIFVVTAVLAAPSFAATVLHRNVVDMIELSELIIVGTVSEVTDGFDQNGVPYTEITLQLKETIQGSERDTYSFRQFGLLQPRDMGNGLVNLNTTLDGWPNYKPDQEVILFLYRQAPITVFRRQLASYRANSTSTGN